MINFTDVNAAISCVEVHGDDQPFTAPLPPLMLFEDNTFIGNVNLIELGSGYGIGGSTRFYGTKLERINHTDSHFAPIRLGFWYWTTRDNYMFDNIPGTGVDLEQAPTFHGNHEGYMEIYYGFTKKVLITDRCGGSPLRNTNISIAIEDLYAATKMTDNDGYLSLELPSVRHLKANNNITRTDYITYTFNVQGYSEYTIATELLKESEKIELINPACGSDTNPEPEPEPEPDQDKVSTEFVSTERVSIAPNPAKDYLSITGLKGGETIHLIDASGSLILTQKAIGNTATIAVNNYNTGIYFIRITGENMDATTLKLLINK